MGGLFFHLFLQILLNMDDPAAPGEPIHPLMQESRFDRQEALETALAEANRRVEELEQRERQLKRDLSLLRIYWNNHLENRS